MNQTREQELAGRHRELVREIGRGRHELAAGVRELQAPVEFVRNAGALGGRLLRLLPVLLPLGVFMLPGMRHRPLRLLAAGLAAVNAFHRARGTVPSRLMQAAEPLVQILYPLAVMAARIPPSLPAPQRPAAGPAGAELQ